MSFNSNNPLGYLGIVPSLQPDFITAQRAPTTNDIQEPGTRWFNQNTLTIYETTGAGNWLVGSNQQATTSTYGIVKLFETDSFAGADDTTVPTSLTVKTYVDATAIAGAPVATETTAGIGQLATDAEAIAGTPSTGALALFVTPSNLAPVLASPTAIGGTAAAAGTFTDLTADGTGAVSLGSNAAADFTVTGAFDLTLSSSAGSIPISAGEAAADAISLQAAAGGLDVDTALLLSLRSSRNNASAIEMVATAGGIDISASGASAGEDIDIVATGSSVNISATENAADSITIVSTAGGIDILASGASAGEDIDIVATGSSVNITSTENNAGAILVTANGGASERITLNAAQGTGADSINLDSTAGGITLAAALASADAINLAASAGGVDIDGALQVNIASSQAAADALRIIASDAAGGIDMDCGTGGATLDSTGAISLDAAAASNFSVTGAGIDLTLASASGSVPISAGEAIANAIGLQAAAGGIDANGALQINIDSSQAAADALRLIASGVAGGIDIDCGTGGISIDSTGAVSLQGAAASDFSVSGAGIDLTLASSAGRVVVNGEEAAADAVRILSAAGGLDTNVALQMNLDSSQAAADAIRVIASNAAGGIDVDAGTAGITVDTTGALSLDAAAASNLTVTGAFDLTINTTAGSLNLTAGESAADSMVFTNNGMDIVTAGAAGRDIDVTNTGGSINITATENVTDAIVITASGAASAFQVDAGTGSFRIGTGLVVAQTSLDNTDSPYTVLGTDYFLDCDTSAGVLTVTLPAATALAGRTFVIRDVGGAAAVNNITINGGGTNLVGGGAAAATKVLSANYSGATVYSNGTIWAYAYTA